MKRDVKKLKMKKIKNFSITLIICIIIGIFLNYYFKTINYFDIIQTFIFTIIFIFYFNPSLLYKLLNFLSLNRNSIITFIFFVIFIIVIFYLFDIHLLNTIECYSGDEGNSDNSNNENKNSENKIKGKTKESDLVNINTNKDI